MVLAGYCFGLSSVFLPLIEYALDYQRIVAEKCENLALPELECNGKCYVSKQIIKQTLPETSEAGANMVVLKLGIDPHSINSVIHPLSLTYSELFLLQDKPFTNIIMEQAGHPPQC